PEHQRVIREHAEAAAVQDDRARHRLQTAFELADDLADADDRVLVLEHALEIELSGAHEMQQRPGRAARLVEDVVDLEPRRLHDDVLAELRGLRGGRLAREINVHAALPDARREPLRQAAEPPLYDDEPFAQVVGTSVEAGV